VVLKAKLIACLNALGINPKMETFSERKLMQKLVYLLQKFGIDLGFYYNWYLHGPYSPGLTRVLFEIVEEGPKRHMALTQEQITKIAELRSILGDDFRSSDKLELIVSIDYLRERARRIRASDREVLKILKKQKPYFTEQEISECWRKSVELEEKLKKS